MYVWSVCLPILISFFGFFLLLLHIRDLHLYFDVNQESHDSKNHFRGQLKQPGWQGVFQLIIFPSYSTEKTLEDFSNISFKSSRLLGLLMLQIFFFFPSMTAIERKRKLSILFIPLRCKQLSQTEILLFADKVKIVRKLWDNQDVSVLCLGFYTLS